MSPIEELAQEYIEYLAQTNLFDGIDFNEIAGLLGCIDARCVEYKKDDLIIEEGSAVHDFGIILTGHGRTIKWDTTGKLIIITLLKKGSEVGAMLSASPGHKSPVSVQAQDDVRALFIPFERVFARCNKNCPRHDKLLHNYINVVAKKGLVLHERIDCLLKPTVREKVMAYLIRLSNEQQSKSILLPLNRNEMSEYLNVERSALSRELSCMKRNNIIDYHMNSFKLL